MEQQPHEQQNSDGKKHNGEDAQYRHIRGRNPHTQTLPFHNLGSIARKNRFRK